MAYDSYPATHCDPIKPECVFDPTSWDEDPEIGPVLKCKTHGLLAPPEVYEQVFVDNSTDLIRGS